MGACQSSRKNRNEIITIKYENYICKIKYNNKTTIGIFGKIPYKLKEIPVLILDKNFFKEIDNSENKKLTLNSSPSLTSALEALIVTVGSFSGTFVSLLE